MILKSKYSRAIIQVLSNYQQGSRSLVVALESLLGTVADQSRAESLNEIAAETCLGQHPGMAKGLICRKCYDFMEVSKLDTNIEDIQYAGAHETPSEKSERSAIEKQVLDMLGAGGDDE